MNSIGKLEAKIRDISFDANLEKEEIIRLLCEQISNTCTQTQISDIVESFDNRARAHK